MMGKLNLSDEFKRDAVVQITELGYPVAMVAMSRSTLKNAAVEASVILATVIFHATSSIDHRLVPLPAQYLPAGEAVQFGKGLG